MEQRTYCRLADAVMWFHGAFVLFALLTPLENQLRKAAEESGYAGGFIEHNLERLGLAGLSRRQLEVRVAWALLMCNAVSYALVLTAP